MKKTILTALAALTLSGCVVSQESSELKKYEFVNDGVCKYSLPGEPIKTVLYFDSNVVRVYGGQEKGYVLKIEGCKNSVFGNNGEAFIKGYTLYYDLK